MVEGLQLSFNGGSLHFFASGLENHSPLAVKVAASVLDFLPASRCTLQSDLDRSSVTPDAPTPDCPVIVHGFFVGKAFKVFVQFANQLIFGAPVDDRRRNVKRNDRRWIHCGRKCFPKFVFFPVLFHSHFVPGVGVAATAGAAGGAIPKFGCKHKTSSMSLS